MPTYEYTCTACKKKTEVIQKITDKALTTCPHCAKETLRKGVGGGIGLAFQGSGFYGTDYCQKPGGCSCHGKKSDPQ